MRRQKCTQCGTMLDVSALEKGSKFACSSCGAILVVGEAVAVKRSLKESGRAFRHRAAPSKGDSAAVPKRTRRRGAGDAAEAAASAGNLPLLIGVGVIVVAAIVVAVFVLGGGGEPGTTGGTGAGGGSTAADWWRPKATKVAVAEAETLRRWIREAAEKGYDRDRAFWVPKEMDLMRALHRKAPDDEQANRYLGRKALDSYGDFDKVWARMNESFNDLPDDLRDFCDKLSTKLDRGKRVWMSVEEFEKAKGKLDLFVAWDRKRRENPAAARIRKSIREASQILKEREFVSGVAGPFIMLFPYKKDEGDTKRAELEDRAKKLARPLEAVHAAFERMIREPLGLAPVQAGRYFTQVVLENPEEFAVFLRGETGFEPQGDVLGFFNLATQWAGVAISADENQAKLVGNDLAHEAVHQLHYYFSKDWSKKWEPPQFDQWSCIWFTEGLAEYIGGGLDIDAATGKATFTGIARRRAAFLQEMRDNGVPLIPLRDLLQLNTVGDWQRYVHGTWMPLMREDEDMAESAITWLDSQGRSLNEKVLYSHAWLVTHFLYEAGDGKYRAKYLDLVRTALRGKAKPEAYRKHQGVQERFADPYDAVRTILGLDENEDAWRKIQKEYERYLPKVLRKARS